MKKQLLSIMVLLYTVMIGQELPTILPPAPDVHNFQKYGDIPVGYYTGIPQINIPLYEVTTRSGLSVPISLKYHAGGIKVDDVASRTGLGWSLNTGGVVSKTISGLLDFTGAFNKPNLNTFNPNDATTNYSDFEYANSVLKGESDSQPDVYSYNFLGSSGKFVFDNAKNLHLIPQQAVKIVPNATMNTFEITDENGNLFIFDRPDLSYVTSSCPTSPSSIESQFNHSWKLTKIKTPYGEEVLFKYRNFSFEYIVANEYTDYIIGSNQYGCPNKAPIACKKTSHNNEGVLEEISFTGGKVTFLYSDDPQYPISGSNTRKDLPGNHALRKVIITNTQGQQIKDFTLRYDYFKTHSGATQKEDYRLKLLSLEEVNADKQHRFIYEETIKLPQRFSKSQDYWGYYNGAGNQSLFPTVFFGGKLIKGGDREVDSERSQAGVLKKIIYPTQGYSEFDYESNDYFSTQGREVHTSKNEFISSVNGINYTSSNDTFEIKQQYKGITIDVTMYCENTETVFDVACAFKIYNTNNEQISFIREPGEYNFDATPGTYRIQYEYVGDSCNCSTQMKWTEKTIEGQNTNVLAGGLRVKKIKNYDGVSTEETLFSYHEENSTQSSGIIQGKPILSHVVTEPGGTLGSCTYLKVSHSSVYPIATALGNSVGYSRVTVVKNNENEHGKTVYTYTNTSDVTQSLLNNPMPITSFDWKRGLLLDTTMYNASGEKVYKETNSYDFDYRFVGNSSESYSATSLISGLLILGTPSNSSIDNTNREFEWSTYDIPSAWIKRTTTTQEQFLPTSFTDHHQYFYDNADHLQVTRIETLDSDTTKRVQKTIYPHDLTQPTVAEQELIDQHRLQEPVAVETIKDGVKNTLYTIYNNDKWFGLTVPQYIQSSKNDSNTENRIVYHSYDAKGNPLEVSQANGSHIMYIWGYHHQYPIAKVTNASYDGIPADVTSVMDQIRTLTDTENSAIVETQIRGLFDQLRGHDYFKDAEITSFTYDPLVGMTSQTDPRGYTMYYQYDEFNRLEFIKDDDDHLISKNEYKYKGQ